MDAITTHTADALASLRSQSVDDEILIGVITVFGDRVQVIENALGTFEKRLSIDDAEGVQLDNIGRVLGQPRRTDQDDTAYKAWLEFRVTELLSEGTREDIIAIFKYLMGASAVTFEESFPAHFRLIATSPDPIVSHGEVRQAIEGAKLAGVGYDIFLPPETPFAFYGDDEGEGFSGIEDLTSGGNLAGLL